ncbi:hypothetical protein B0H11DRAFT_1723282, partial [Mycena galericulata]
RLYMARIDLHLTFECEVCLDVVAEHIGELTDVEHEFICWLSVFQFPLHSVRPFHGTGVIPLCYHRPILALGYLMYLIALPPNHLATAAYMDSVYLSAAG